MFMNLGDHIVLRTRTSCSSSSSSCHHTSAVYTCTNGKWGGGYYYHNHSGSYSTYIDVPNVKQSNKIYYTSSSSQTHPATTDEMGRIYTIYDKDLDASNNYNPFGSPDMVYIKVNGAWVNCADIAVKVNGAWSEPKGIWVKQNGAWVNVY